LFGARSNQNSKVGSHRCPRSQKKDLSRVKTDFKFLYGVSIETGKHARSSRQALLFIDKN